MPAWFRGGHVREERGIKLVQGCDDTNILDGLRKRQSARLSPKVCISQTRIHLVKVDSPLAKRSSDTNDIAGEVSKVADDELRVESPLRGKGKARGRDAPATRAAFNPGACKGELCNAF